MANVGISNVLYCIQKKHVTILVQLERVGGSPHNFDNVDTQRIIMATIRFEYDSLHVQDIRTSPSNWLLKLNRYFAYLEN